VRGELSQRSMGRSFLSTGLSFGLSFLSIGLLSLSFGLSFLSFLSFLSVGLWSLSLGLSIGLSFLPPLKLPPPLPKPPRNGERDLRGPNPRGVRERCGRRFITGDLAGDGVRLRGGDLPR
jgi:hypothetical protein